MKGSDIILNSSKNRMLKGSGLQSVSCRQKENQSITIPEINVRFSVYLRLVLYVKYGGD
jgi:hypothetical protein